MKKNIVNIINFIRGVDPRYPELDLLEPVINQIRLIKEFKLCGTFLIQYDAMIIEEYANLLKKEMNEYIEIGAWLEIVQPLVEKAGIHWRGRKGFAWDWHANVGFSVGYLPEERERLVDVYMEDFKKIFGSYPSSVGSWIIDAHTMAYLSHNYGITAACNCKDQWGTDGYTLWGGYYGQAYYPSRWNAFTPAQTSENQIPVPIFRMLGSDPIYQYDAGLQTEDGFGATEIQPVITLEPVYNEGGGSSQWVKWYFKENFNNLCLSFGYTQAGQENSFGWQAMEDGFTNQLKIISRKVRSGDLTVETLMDSGKWFKSVYDVTPASSISALTDWKNEGHKSIWYSSRYYRINLYWEENKFWIRDIQCFKEEYKERYLKHICENENLVYDNLPVIDGNRWSSGKIHAGIYPVNILKDNSTALLLGGEIKVVEVNNEELMINWALGQGGELQILCKSKNIELHFIDVVKENKCCMKMMWGENIITPIEKVNGDTVQYKYNDYEYNINSFVGSFVGMNKKNEVLILPDSDKICIKFG